MLDRRRSVVVNMIAYEGSPLTAAYAATVGSRSLVLTTAREIGADSGVAVYAFIPGTVDTPVIHETLAPGIASRIGLSTDEVISTILSQNPGYVGLLPLEHCSAARIVALTLIVILIGSLAYLRFARPRRAPFPRCESGRAAAQAVSLHDRERQLRRRVQNTCRTGKSGRPPGAADRAPSDPDHRDCGGRWCAPLSAGGWDSTPLRDSSL